MTIEFEIGGPAGTKTNPHLLALCLVQLNLARGSTRAKDVSGRLDAAHLTFKLTNNTMFSR